MKRVSISVQVQTGSKSKPTLYALNVDQESPCLTDVMKEMAQTEWGRVLFEEDETSLRPGQLVILNNRAVQPWEMDGVVVTDGSALAIVPFVAGG